MSRLQEWTKEDYEYALRKAEREIEELKADNRRKRDEIDHQKFRIENELEPMIKQKNRAYDAWVSNAEKVM